MVKEKLLIQKKSILGVNTNVKSIHLLDEEQILYSCGNHVLIWNKHSKKHIFLYQCSSGEEIQIIELFASRKQIAISTRKNHAEGVKIGGPQILIYDAITFRRKKIIKLQTTNNDSNDDSDALSLSFSIDSKQCIVLRDAPHYQLTLWNIEKSVAKTIATIRLATPSGKELKKASIRPSLGSSSDYKDVTVCASGNGIVRFFKVVDGIFRPITVNLHRQQQNYIVQCWVSNEIVILGTDSNELIVMQNFVTKIVVFVDGWDEFITSMIPFSHGIIIGGNKGTIRVYTCIKENNYTPFLSKEFSLDNKRTSKIIAIDKVTTGEMSICLLSNGKICSFPLSDNNIMIGENIVQWFHDVGPDGNSCIKCMDVCPSKPIIATAGADKSLRIWNFETNEFELMSSFQDDIISVSLHPSSLQILICFKNYVELSYIYQKNLSTVWCRGDLETNGSSCFSNGGQYFAIVSGPFIQIIGTYKFDTICTLRGHSEPIKAVAWRYDDQEFATLGADSVICMWSIPSGKRNSRYVSESSMYVGGCFNSNLDVAIVNTTQEIGMLDMSTLLFKSELGFPSEAIVQCWTEGMIIGSSMDESLQGDVWFSTVKKDGSIEHYQQRKLHSKGISCILFSRSHLFTASEDGSLCICKLSKSDTSDDKKDTIKTMLNPITFEHLLVPEKDLTEKDNRIIELRHQIDRVKLLQHQELETLDRMYKEKILNLKNKINSMSASISQQKGNSESELIKKKKHLESSFDSKIKEFEAKTKALKSKQEHESEAKERENRQFETVQQERVKAWEIEKRALVSNYAREEEEIIDEIEQKIQIEHQKYHNIMAKKKELITKHEEMIDAMEEDGDREMTVEAKSFKSIALRERKIASRLREENDITKKKYDALIKDSEEHKETIVSLREKQSDLSNSIVRLRKLKLDQEQKLKEVEQKIKKVDIKINNATEETHKMERSKIDQSKYIKELKSILLSKEVQLKSLNERGNGLDVDLKKSRQYNDKLRVQVENVEQQLKSLNKELASKSKQLNIKAAEISMLEVQFQGLSNYLDNFNELKRHVVALSHEYNEQNILMRRSMNNHSTQTSLKDRKSDLLRKKIGKKKDIAEKNRILHQARVRKLKGDQVTLEAQLKEVEQDAKCITQKQAAIFEQSGINDAV